MIKIEKHARPHPGPLPRERENLWQTFNKGTIWCVSLSSGDCENVRLLLRPGHATPIATASFRPRRGRALCTGEMFGGSKSENSFRGNLSPTLSSSPEILRGAVRERGFIGYALSLEVLKSGSHRRKGWIFSATAQFVRLSLRRQQRFFRHVLDARRFFQTVRDVSAASSLVPRFCSSKLFRPRLSRRPPFRQSVFQCGFGSLQLDSSAKQFRTIQNAIRY